MKSLNETREAIAEFTKDLVEASLRPSFIKEVKFNGPSLQWTMCLNSEKEEAKDYFFDEEALGVFIKQIGMPVKVFNLLYQSDRDLLIKAIKIFLSEVSSRKAWSVVHRENEIVGIFPRVYRYYDPVSIFDKFIAAFPEYNFYRGELYPYGNFAVYLEKDNILTIMKYSSFHEFSPKFSYGTVVCGDMILDFEDLGDTGSLVKEKFDSILESFTTKKSMFASLVSAQVNFIDSFKEVEIPEVYEEINQKKIRYFGRRLGFPGSTITAILQEYESSGAQPTDFNLKILLEDLSCAYIGDSFSSDVPVKVGRFISTSKECTRLGNDFIGKDDLSVPKLQQIAFRK